MKLSLTERILSLLAPEERLTIVDGGARNALADPRWAALGRARIYGFDPDTAEVERLNREAGALGLDFHYFPAGLSGSSGRATFHENNTPSGGSILEQNRAVTDRWKWPRPSGSVNARDVFFPVTAHEIDVISLDDWAMRAGIRDIDFLKLNIQGAELGVLRAASSLIRGIVGIHIEVSFVESYRDRPMFSDIDEYLRAHDFTFFDLLMPHYVGRAGSPIVRREGPHGLGPGGQLVEGHALYFKDPIGLVAQSRNVGHLSTAKLLKLACFAECFNQLELALELLNWLATTRPEEVACRHLPALIASTLDEYRQAAGAPAQQAGKHEGA